MVFPSIFLFNCTFLKEKENQYCFFQFEIVVDNKESTFAISDLETEDSLASFGMYIFSFLENLLLVFKKGLF